MIYAGQPARGRRFTLRDIRLIFGLVLLCFILLVAAAGGVGLYLLMLGLVVATLVLAWRKPIKTAIFFAAFLPVNRFVILLVFHLTGSGPLTKSFQLWKDVVMMLLLTRVIYDALFIRKAPRIKYLDLLVIFFVGLSAVYIFYQGPDDLITRIQGFRTDASFMLAYFIGRGLHLELRHVRSLLLALVPGSVAVAAVAAFQFAMPALSNGILLALGYKEFIQLQGGLGEELAVRGRALAGGVSIPRASSLLLGDLALAFFGVMLVGLAAALFFEARSERKRILSGAFLLAMIGTLALTVTRSAIFAVAPTLVVLGVFARSMGKLVAIGGITITLALSGLLLTGIQPRSVQELLNPREASAVAHENAFVKSLQIIQDAPLGHGLGTAGTIGQRYDASQSITNESWYLQLATEMGPTGALVYLGLTCAVLITCFRTYRHLRDVWLRSVVLGMAGAAMGFLLVSNFLHAWENTVLSMLFWMFAGIAVRARDIDQQVDAGP